MKLLISIIILFTLQQSIAQKSMKIGIWRGVLTLNKEKNIELPFNFEFKMVASRASATNKKITKKPVIIIQNALEYITITEISLKKDSVNFKMPVFDSEFKCQLIGDTTLKGVWINHSKKDASRASASIDFKAQQGISQRFLFPTTVDEPFYNGKWEVAFSPNTKDSSKAIGLFTQPYAGANVFGTFLTETGDYRYLDGMTHNGKMYLSAFDGAHAFLFIAENNGKKIINGKFYSGSTWEENWTAKRNENFQLRNPETITQLKSPNEVVKFSFPNLIGKKISLTDKKYLNKPVIIQIMGSWCPNCMDETAYLSQLYKTYKPLGLEIIALAYERTSDFKKASKNVTRLKTKFNASYEFLITDLSGKDKASESLPFLNSVTAFPTTIVLDKKHQVKTIYTGFSGPATEEEYRAFTQKFETLITQLLK